MGSSSPKGFQLVARGLVVLGCAAFAVASKGFFFTTVGGEADAVDVGEGVEADAMPDLTSVLLRDEPFGGRRGRGAMGGDTSLVPTLVLVLVLVLPPLLLLLLLLLALFMLLTAIATEFILFNELENACLPPEV